MPITAIPDTVNHAALLRALQIIRAEVESRQEDVGNIAAWSAEAADRAAGIAEELQALNVDTFTIGNVHAVRDALSLQAASAGRYAALTDTSVQQAEIAARGAHRRHGRIEEAVNDAPVPMATPSFYKPE